MKVIDIIFSLICGRVIGFLMGDFLKEWGIQLVWWYFFIVWILLPLISFLCLWIAYMIGRKFPFIFQGAKFLLVGAFATVLDLKLFELLLWFFIPISLISKGISFIIATLLKFWGNKYWTFQKHEKEDVNKEMIQFSLVTLIGLIIDLGFFYYFTRILGPQFQISSALWVKLSVIFSALAAALCNFLGYKFLVFKK